MKNKLERKIYEVIYSELKLKQESKLIDEIYEMQDSKTKKQAQVSENKNETADA